MCDIVGHLMRLLEVFSPLHGQSEETDYAVELLKDGTVRVVISDIQAAQSKPFVHGLRDDAQSNSSRSSDDPYIG